MKPETVLTLPCRCCGHVMQFVTSDADAVGVECAFCDGAEVLSFQVIDAEGQLRTAHIRRDDVRSVTRVPLTLKERGDIERQMRGEKPLPTLAEMMMGISPPRTAKGKK